MHETRIAQCLMQFGDTIVRVKSGSSLIQDNNNLSKYLLNISVKKKAAS